MTVTGQDWDRLEDSLTWPRIVALYDYWRQSPPSHVLLAGYVGYKPPEKPKTLEELRNAKGKAGEMSIAELEGVFGGKFSIV
jgi:hypothetical protein